MKNRIFLFNINNIFSLFLLRGKQKIVIYRSVSFSEFSSDGLKCAVRILKFYLKNRIILYRGKTENSNL